MLSCMTFTFDLWIHKGHILFYCLFNTMVGLLFWKQAEKCHVSQTLVSLSVSDLLYLGIRYQILSYLKLRRLKQPTSEWNSSSCAGPLGTKSQSLVAHNLKTRCIFFQKDDITPVFGGSRGYWTLNCGSSF